MSSTAIPLGSLSQSSCIGKTTVKGFFDSLSYMFFRKTRSRYIGDRPRDRRDWKSISRGDFRRRDAACMKPDAIPPPGSRSWYRDMDLGRNDVR